MDVVSGAGQPMGTTMALRELTTLRLGGPCQDVVAADSEASLIEAVAAADSAGRQVLLLSGGSNVVVADSGFDGRVVLVRTRGVAVGQVEGDPDLVVAAAGESWPRFVMEMVAAGRSGVEALAGIPGCVGSTPIQNVGAYGQEVADTIASVRVWDRDAAVVRELPPAACGFAYRSSTFKIRPQRYVVLAVNFRLPRRQDSSPIRYPELAARLGVDVGRPAPLADVSRTVLELRRGKGMVLDAQDHDTWSAGSFFTNPVLTPAEAAELDPAAPRFDAGGGRVKTSAAWLIQHAGFTKGYRLQPTAPVSISTKHTLALTNRGGASTADLLALARTVRAGVRAKFGVTLVPEPVLVGCAL
jgi:UDP-N-acetylmuramate dehydrogenase